jgi:hypothetical protein
MTPEKLTSKVMSIVREKQPESYDAWFSLIVCETLEQAARALDEWEDMYGDAAAAAVRALKDQDNASRP